MVSLKGFWLNRSEPPLVLGFAYGDHYAWNCSVEVKLYWARFPCWLRLVESSTTGDSSKELSSAYCLVVLRCVVPRIVSSIRVMWVMAPFIQCQPFLLGIFPDMPIPRRFFKGHPLLRPGSGVGCWYLTKPQADIRPSFA